MLRISPAALAKDRNAMGQFLETFVVNELERQAAAYETPLSFYHYRDRDQFEVDIVIERDWMTIAGVEVKAAATVRQSDFRGLRKLKSLAGDRFAAGVILYDGGTTVGFGDGMFAVPLRRLVEGT